MALYPVISDAISERMRFLVLSRIRASQGKNRGLIVNLDVQEVHGAESKKAQALQRQCEVYSANAPVDSLAHAHGELELWGKFKPLREISQVKPFDQAKIDEIKGANYISAIVPVTLPDRAAAPAGSLVDNFSRALDSLLFELDRTGNDFDVYGYSPADWHVSLFGITLKQEGIEALSPAAYQQPVKTAVTNMFPGQADKLSIDFMGLNVGITPAGIAIGFRGYPTDNSVVLGMRDNIEKEIKASGQRLDEGFRLRLITYLIGFRLFPKQELNPSAIKAIVDFMSKYADTYFGAMTEIGPDDIVIRKGRGPAMATIEEIRLTI